MRYALLSLLALVSTTSTVAALPQPATGPASTALDARWCKAVGRGCWKAKRAGPTPFPPPAAEPAAEDDDDALEARWCKAVGRGCWKVKRAATAFADSLAASGPASTGAEADASNAPGGAAHAAKRAVDSLAGLVAITQDAPQEFYDALQLGEHFEPDSDHGDSGNGGPGTKIHKVDARWCAGDGRACAKARRAAEELVRTVEAFAPEDDSRVGRRWCTSMGRGCWKRDEGVSEAERRCNAPGGQCSKARRDLTAMYHAARGVLDGLETS